MLDAEDVLGKRIVTTRLQRNVTIREENATAALEVMSRFAANPKWLIYLPPTMSPCETSGEPGLLEHPAEAFAYYRSEGVAAGRLRGEAHGLAGGRRSSAGTRRRRGERFGVIERRDRASSTPAPAGGSSTTRTLERQFLDRVRDGARRGRLLGRAATPTGSASTAS